MRDTLFEKKYRIDALIGEGGMGKVYAATNMYSNAEVAIKCIPRDRGNPDLAARLLKESATLAVLVHPNIVRMYDAGVTEEGVVYIVMERIAGVPLRRLIADADATGARLDLRLALHVMAQVAEAMSFAHAKGVTHRDLKPENIMVAEGDHAYVLDFGIAKQGAAFGGKKSMLVETDPASVLGTPRYMAPEQIRGKTVDGRTDIYAIGITLYEAISGRRPYDAHEDDAATVTEIMGHHVFTEPTPLREIAPDCPDSVWTIVLRCLAKDPADRFASMSDLRGSLHAALAEHLSARKAPPRVGSVTEPIGASYELRPPLPFSERSPKAPALSKAPAELRSTAPLPPEFRAQKPLPFRRARSEILSPKGTPG